MAYITSEQVKEMRDMIKKAFPAARGWKWSVTREHHTAVCASLMQYPEGYNFPDYEQVNIYWFDNPGVNGKTHFGEKETKVLQKVNKILHTGHWDHSDIMTDYFSCSHYVHLHIGKWDRPAVKVAPKASRKQKAIPAPAGDNYTAAEFERVAEFIGINF